MKKIVSLLLALVIILGLTVSACAITGNEYTPGSVYNPFSDIHRKNYMDNHGATSAFDAVMWAYTTGVTSGISSNYFGLNETVTRGQVVTFLWRYMGSPEPAAANNPFADVHSSDYFYKPVLWAVERGICNGTSATMFSPNQTCTYAHLVTFLYRAQGCPEYSRGDASYSFREREFEECTAWFRDAALWAGSKRILAGTTPSYKLNEVTPTTIETECPRQDVVYMLYLFESKVNNDGYFTNISLTHVMDNPAYEIPEVNLAGRENGKDYYISLNAEGTKLLKCISSDPFDSITVDPYAATNFRVVRVGEDDTFYAQDFDVTKPVTACNHPSYSTLVQHYTIQYATNTRTFDYLACSALDIASAQDTPGSWVIGYPLLGNLNQCFDFEAGANGTVYIKTLGGNYVKFVESDNYTGMLLVSSAAEATEFYFMPIAQFGK